MVGSSSLCFCVDGSVDAIAAFVVVLCASCGRGTSGTCLCVTCQSGNQSKNNTEQHPNTPKHTQTNQNKPKQTKTHRNKQKQKQTRQTRQTKQTTQTPNHPTTQTNKQTHKHDTHTHSKRGCCFCFAPTLGCCLLSVRAFCFLFSGVSVVVCFCSVIVLFAALCCCCCFVLLSGALALCCRSSLLPLSDYRCRLMLACQMMLLCCFCKLRFSVQ